MPVFDFNNTPDKDKPLTCTYTTFRSDESTATPERPMLVLEITNAPKVAVEISDMGVPEVAGLKAYYEVRLSV